MAKSKWKIKPTVSLLHLFFFKYTNIINYGKIKLFLSRYLILDCLCVIFFKYVYVHTGKGFKQININKLFTNVRLTSFVKKNTRTLHKKSLTRSKVKVNRVFATPETTVQFKFF